MNSVRYKLQLEWRQSGRRIKFECCRNTRICRSRRGNRRRCSKNNTCKTTCEIAARANAGDMDKQGNEWSGRRVASRRGRLLQRALMLVLRAWRFAEGAPVAWPQSGLGMRHADTGRATLLKVSQSLELTKIFYFFKNFTENGAVPRLSILDSQPIRYIELKSVLFINIAVFLTSLLISSVVFGLEAELAAPREHPAPWLLARGVMAEL